MDVNTKQMEEYARFLQEHSHKIVALCQTMEDLLAMAVQCMDQNSGRAAAARMAQNIENVKKSVPISDDAAKRLVLSKKYIDSAGQVFGR